MAYQPKSYRKFVATTATAAMVASAVAPVVSAAAGFTDVASQYKDAVDFLVSAGVKGKSETKFGVYDEITRLDAAVILAKVLKLDVDNAKDAGFTDVPKDRAKYVNALVDAGVLNGKAAGKFGAYDKLTRAEMAKIIANAYKLKGDDVTLPFTDVNDTWAPYVKALYKNGITKGKSETKFGANDNITRGDFAVFVYRAANVDVAPQVVSVSAINAAQLQVKFNKAIDKSTVIDSNDTLKSGVLTITKVDGTGDVTIDDNSLASLSEDGKTLTITVTSGALNSMKYVVNVPENTVKTTDGKYVEKYVSGVLTASDSTAPTITKTEKLNASTVRVYFSEPLSSAGSWTFKLADGSDATVTPTPNLAKGYVDLAIGASVAAGKEITATVIGAADYANNLINPNPVTVKFTKGQLDGVKPTVTSVNVLGLNKFEVKFSEEVQGFDATDITIDSSTTFTDYATDGDTLLEAGEAKVTQDAIDKTKYTVELGAALTAGLHTINIAANAVSDLSGEQNDAYSKVVEFKADTTAPKLVSSEVKKENGAEYLYLTFDEPVTKGTVDALAAKQVKDYVTTTGTIDLSGLTPVSGTDNKQYKVALNAVQFTPTSGTPVALSTGATYTVTLTNFTDANSNALEDTTITFNRGSDTDTNKPAIVTTFDGNEAGNHVDNNGIKVVDNDTIQVQFDRALDGATATNKANYQVNGLTVESATLLPNNVVEIKLAADTNTLSGLRNVTISGVKSKDGVLMDTFTASEYFVENVKPYVKSATLIAPNQIKVEFSEPVQVSTATAEDFDVYVGSVKEGEGAGSQLLQNLEHLELMNLNLSSLLKMIYLQLNMLKQLLLK
ncbi:S-layer homology domain-containing protein [Saccharococcus caldoxylosilyticus]|uniref:S-layer homology domain-containing protein n=1 Tax=Saccharococcus caldoxylosilyticus TaxID=81408 RepID=UPI0002D518F5|nr:S-layer homology domain-containing protein [Parageobacillus caldoxylosilyticus]